ncbi:platelet-activating factor acetylhydrolase, isoform II-domain-containing protein [Pyronema omphalodes]|nr:platelet-activating factor acetylhydrolase, isoform II-domain-containing protein [Pyronema omphalodes]
MSFLSRLKVVPQFPSYKGPYTVASFELEIPVSSLPTSQKPPASAENVSTVQFRVFYPTGQKYKPADAENAPPNPPSGDTTEANGAVDGVTNVTLENGSNGAGVVDSSQKPATNGSWMPGWFSRGSSTATKSVYWLPEPHQREYLSGYVRFLGAGSGLAEIISYIPRILHHIALPAISQAPLLPSNTEFKFPTVLFSHGLGGTRLAYSHLCGSLASYGNIVIAPEHRDGSAPVTFIKPGSSPSSSETEITGATPKPAEPSAQRIQVDYTNYPHQISDITAQGRNRQLEIRLWELSVIYSALTQLDLGQIPAGTQMFDADTTLRDELLGQFKEKLDIREPGRMIWAGHSFGSATMIQLIKSVYYGSRSTAPADEEPLFIPDPVVPRGPGQQGACSLGEQITDKSPLMLLDIWCLPLLSARTRPLWKLPLPQVKNGNADRVLVIMSDEFFRWRENLRGVRRILSEDPGRRRGGPEHKVFEQWDKAGEFHPQNDVPTPGIEVTGQQIIAPMTSKSPSPPPEEEKKDGKEKQVQFWYVKDSAHLSQSDFGVLFPRAIKRAKEPERILDYNVRAACQWLRESGYDKQVAEYGGEGEKLDEMKLGEKEKGDNIFGEDTECWVKIPLEG